MRIFYFTWGMLTPSIQDGHNAMFKVSVMPIVPPRKGNRRWLCLLCASVFLLPLGTGAEEVADKVEETAAVAESAVSAEDAGRRIDEFHLALLEVMKVAAALGFDGRAKRLQELLPAYIDQGYMAKKTLGRKWKKLTAQQRKDFLEAFYVLNVYSYADRFSGYSGEKFETLSSELDEQGDAKVESRVVIMDGDPVRLLYRMHIVDGRWLVKDVYLNGSVSEMALRRSEYSSILKAEGIDALIVALWAKSDAMMKDDMADSKAISKE